MAEIISYYEPFTDDKGNKWIKVAISFNAVSQINKIVLGDKLDEDNKTQRELRNQVHEDCLKLIKEFKDGSG